MKKREIAGIICLALLSVVPSHDALAYSYAEVMAGLAAPTGLEVHHSNDADRVTPGPVATTLVLQGLFPVSDPVYFSPSFSYLSTGGNVEGDPVPPANYGIRFQQSELAVDLLWRPGGLNRFRLGPGISAAWWTAAEDFDIPPAAYQYSDYTYRTRVTRGQSVLMRGVVHLMLRDPEVTGLSAKFIFGLPMTDILSLENSAATGYVALNLGFSMILN